MSVLKMVELEIEFYGDVLRYNSVVESGGIEGIVEDKLAVLQGKRHEIKERIAKGEKVY